MTTVINCQENKFLNLFQLELLSKIVEKMKAGSFNFIYPFILRFKAIYTKPRANKDFENKYYD